MTAKQCEQQALEALREELDVMQARISVLTEENSLLGDCLLEMSGMIFAEPDRKVGKATATLFAKKIMTGERKAGETPRLLEAQVHALLRAAGCAGLMREGKGGDDGL